MAVGEVGKKFRLLDSAVLPLMREKMSNEVWSKNYGDAVDWHSPPIPLVDKGLWWR